MRNYSSTYNNVVSDMHERGRRIEKLEAQLREARKDAERLDHIIKTNTAFHWVDDINVLCDTIEAMASEFPYSKERFNEEYVKNYRAAIDASIAKTAK